jgi:hypothetical protein
VTHVDPNPIETRIAVLRGARHLSVQGNDMTAPTLNGHPLYRLGGIPMTRLNMLVKAAGLA